MFSKFLEKRFHGLNRSFNIVGMMYEDNWRCCSIILSTSVMKFRLGFADEYDVVDVLEVIAASLDIFITLRKR